MTSADAFQPQPKAEERAMLFHGFQTIMRAGWIVATPAAGTTEKVDQRRDKNLIPADEEFDNCPHGTAWGGEEVSGCGGIKMEAFPASRSHSFFKSGAVQVVIGLRATSTNQNPG